MTNYSSIPESLRSVKQWVCFKLVWNVDKNKFDKIPYNPAGYRAKANDPNTWADYETAAAAAGRGLYDGIGIELDNGICGIDLDHVVNPDGSLTAEAADIIQTMNSYTEYSISGTGIHILFTGRIPDQDRRNGSVEMYSNGRYLTITGNIIGSPAVNERTAEAAAVHDKYIKRVPAAPERPPKQAQQPPRTGIISKGNLLFKMINSAAGASIRALWDGDISAYVDPKTHETDHSRADQALTNHLAYWCNGDREQMDVMFRCSALMRPKWDEQHGSITYGQLTINKALETFVPYIPERKETHR